MIGKSLIDRIRRVLQVASKPTKEEFKTGSKISGLGIALIGIIGFAIFLATQVAGEISLVFMMLAIIIVMSIGGK